MYKKIFTVLVFLSISVSAQLQITKIEPPNWWTNHPYDSLQLLVHGNNLDLLKVKSDNSNLSITNIYVSENKKYAFVDVFLKSNIKPSNSKLTFSNNFGKSTKNFSILKRESVQNRHQGFSNKDVVYLIFPDRFANGDASNDFLFNEKEEFEFGSLNGRHGGDIQGIINKLDYIKDLGVTTIWITPLLENNMYMSYHGYATTDLYKIDPRFGTNELYKSLVEKVHEKGLKIIYDHVSNHIGINHPWSNNTPTKTWFNGTVGNHKNAFHNKMAYVDVHGDSSSIIKSQTGWFTDYMPDLNQRDPKLAKYLIQNTIWWIESTGLDGIREDTYPYNDQKFMSDWAKTILEIYPNFNIVGEVWKGEPTVLAKYQTKSFFPREFDSNLPSVTDFAFKDVLDNYLNNTSELYAVYELFAKDFVYSNPNNLLTFLDNHDTDRAMFSANNNFEKLRVALTILLTTRGIPQLFYGTEIGLNNGKHHGKIRQEFPGSFRNNKRNAFVDSERTSLENKIYHFTKKLLHLRKRYKALSVGELKHYPPEKKLYVYTKTFNKQKIIIFINDDDFDKSINLKDYFDIENLDDFILKDLFSDGDCNTHEHNILISKKSVKLFLIQ
ncbi:MAG: alpha-amylase [Ignavibacteriae bacterium]|nr:alpha-amylase [Ignavibacteriota bacterium]